MQDSLKLWPYQSCSHCCGHRCCYPVQPLILSGHICHSLSQKFLPITIVFRIGLTVGGFEVMSANDGVLGDNLRRFDLFGTDCCDNVSDQFRVCKLKLNLRLEVLVLEATIVVVGSRYSLTPRQWMNISECNFNIWCAQ